MTIGLILSVLALIISAVIWGFGANSSNHTWPAEAPAFALVLRKTGGP